MMPVKQTTLHYQEHPSGTGRFDTSRFNTNSSGENAQKFRSLQI